MDTWTSLDKIVFVHFVHQIEYMDTWTSLDKIVFVHFVHQIRIHGHVDKLGQNPPHLLHFCWFAEVADAEVEYKCEEDAGDEVAGEYIELVLIIALVGGDDGVHICQYQHGRKTKVYGHAAPCSQQYYHVYQHPQGGKACEQKSSNGIAQCLATPWVGQCKGWQ